MKLKEIYQLAVEMGMEADPRGKQAVERDLRLTRKSYEKLEAEDKAFFDTESLTNPYSDTRILWGDPEKEVKRILVGIDIEAGELLLADRLREKGKEIDLVLAHHPEGRAFAALHQVMHIQSDLLYQWGVPVNIAESIMAGRIKEVMRNIMPYNHQRPVDVARLLEIPLMCCHTPSDNLVTSWLQKYLDEKQPETIADLLKVLKTIPEYAEAARQGAGPTIFVGDESRRCGRIFVDMTGGTGGSEDAYDEWARAGVGTLVGMHISEKHRERAEKARVNVVIAGHIASDSLGMNLFLDRLEAAGIEIISCSGLIRVRR